MSGRVDCSDLSKIRDCESIDLDTNTTCDDYFITDGDDRYICEEDPSKSRPKKCDKGKRCKGGREGDRSSTSIASLEDYETMRIIITYLVVFFMILALMATSDSKDSLLVMMSFTILYLVTCAIFDYFWMTKYLIENRTTGDTSKRETFHKILHMLLPGIVIIFGYSFLLSGFKTILDVSNIKSLLLFMIKLISLIVIIIGYLYYTIRLKEIVSDSNKNKDTNTQIDILYSILHPVAILLISGVFYMLILFFINRRKTIVTSVTAPAPAPIPTAAPAAQTVVNPVR